MRVLNTSHRGYGYLFHLWCPACPSALAVSAVAWMMPEGSFPEMLENHRDWCRCTVCLRPMEAIGHVPLDTKEKREIVVRYLGHEPKPGRIEIIL